jgi:hypothetical protein
VRNSARIVPAWLGIFAGYAALFAVLAGPWLAHAAHSIPINTIYARGDTRLLTWILWWVAQALLQNPTAILDAPINYPAPSQITGSEHFAALQVLFLPVYATTGNPVLALNAILFVSYPLAALAMNRLLAALGFSAAVAWVIGLAYALGALQVPANVHMLHTLAFHLPATALALHRLRETPDARRAAVLAALVFLAFFSAYYTTAIVLPVIAAWGAAELLRPLPGRRRFAIIVCAVVAGCLGALAVASLPYLARGASLASSNEQRLLLRRMTAMTMVYLAVAPVQIFGAGALALGIAGCCAVRHRRWRPLTVLALLLLACSVFLISGAGLAVTQRLPSETLAEMLAAPLAFVRVVIRYAAIAGFALALLGAVALQRARDGLSYRAGLALVALLGLAVTIERGRLLFRQTLETSPALTSEAPVYRRLARVVASDGGGPLLELPVSSFGYSLQPEAMMGEIHHGQPLIVGHTGYPAPHRPLVDQTIADLPAEDAVQGLVDLTHLRWLVIRPVAYWGDAATRTQLLHDLESVAGVHRRADVDGWTVLEIVRAPQHQELFAAIAHGGGAMPAIPSARTAADAQIDHVAAR